MDIKRTLDLMVNSVKNTIGAKAFIHAIARNWEGVALRQEIMPLLDPKEEQIISAAMILAGLEKGEGDLAEAQDSFPLMDCVFDRLDWDSADSPHFYPPINLDHKHDNVTPYPETEFAQDKRDNSQHWGFFFERFEKLRHPDMPELISLAETYLSYIPVVAKRNQDISVFDFAKMTAAYSECIQKSDPDKRDLPFILFGADFSGVQKFIYSITSKGALKTLRARSFYLELLVEHAVYEILTGFGLSHANVIISGGGRFTLILPNSEKLLDLVKKVISTMNAFLLKHLEGKLYIVHGTVELSRGDIKNIWTKWRELGGEIAKNKRQKFSDLFESRQGCCFNDLFKPQLFDEDSSLDLKISEFDSERECGYCNSSGGK